MKKRLFGALAALLAGAALGAAETALSVPFFPKVQLTADGIPSEPFWTKSASITEFQRVFKGGSYGPGTEVKLCRDAENLYVALIAKSPAGTAVAATGEGCWSGDNVEVFLAGRTKHGWNLAQAVLGSNGSVYSERLRSGQWQGFRHVAPETWSAEIVIPFAALRFDENKLYFNVLSRRHREGLTLSWVKLPLFAHEPDCFGKLEFAVPADSVTHGPWSFEITGNSAGIAWETAAPCGGAVKIHPAGQPKAVRTVAADNCGGVPGRSRDLHTVKLTGLQPDTEYIYSIGDGAEYSLRTLAEKPEDFSAVFTSDVHSHAQLLDTMFARADVQKCDLFFALGDQLTGSLGREALYEGFLDAVVRAWHKPFYVLRGNHEYRGPCPEVNFECFHDGVCRDYGIFCHKGVCFVLLDGDGDGDPAAMREYLKGETEFLHDAVRSPEFRNAQFRVLLTHKPLCLQGGDTELGAMLQTLSHEELAKFDLNLAGHQHAWGKAPANGKNFISAHRKLNGKPLPVQLPFPVVVNGAGTVMILEKRADVLTLRTYETGDLKPRETIQLPLRRQKARGE